MSNTLSQKSLNMWRNATLVNPTLSGTITLPATSNLKFQSASGFVATIVSATAAVSTLPINLTATSTLTSLSVACNVAPTVGSATFTFSRRTAAGVKSAITDGVVTVPTTAGIGETVSATVSQSFVAGDTLIVTVGGGNTAAGTANFAGLFTVA
jgi:hypothetical protein